VIVRLPHDWTSDPAFNARRKPRPKVKLTYDGKSILLEPVRP